MADVIQVSKELEKIAITIGEAANLVSSATESYRQIYINFIANYSGQANSDEVILATNFLSNLATLDYFYVQAQYYVNYCFENIKDLDIQEANSYNSNKG
jgi:hypothetical protein